MNFRRGIRPRGIAGIVWDLHNPNARLDEFLAERPRIARAVIVIGVREKQRQFAARALKRK